jgi:hypothetical protein
MQYLDSLRNAGVLAAGAARSPIWSGFGTGSRLPLIRLYSAQESVETGGEAFVAVAGPGVGAVSDEGGEATGGQGAEERVQLLSGRGVAKALFGGRCGIGESESESVVVDAVFFRVAGPLAWPDARKNEMTVTTRSGSHAEYHRTRGSDQPGGVRQAAAAPATG